MRYCTSPIGKILGKSQWIDVDGDAIGKWSQQEGDIAIQLLSRLLDAEITNPDIFFITPFRFVAQKLRETLRAHTSIRQRLPIKTWTNERVGTVHTFQGKEAEAVVLVLGAPLEQSSGARRWAGHPPNLLNVAVSRAKRRLYVVGSYRAWKDAGAFRTLAAALPLTSLDHRSSSAAGDMWKSGKR